MLQNIKTYSASILDLYYLQIIIIIKVKISGHPLVYRMEVKTQVT